ncbi:hypothetical protein EJ06DRAFT_487213 [Trichodelitschia bisporula]|uniref:gamma-glutamylcyclotransferase n=1 Tax=Trichodelitschia bisporula TaxID=703511 RepID=A0A6G1I8Q7_9PEZI|nr:hypothetical protein EJ06DRAFT_487213 [Trichodelitschia bisporula]
MAFTGLPYITIPQAPATPASSLTPSPTHADRTLYFAYATNLWSKQITQRCPSAQIIGVARLRHFQFQICARGYANIVESPPAPYSPQTTSWLGPLSNGDLRDDTDRVFGIVYSLSAEDEEALDAFGDVPATYGKEWVSVELWARKEEDKAPIEVAKRKAKKARVMAYIDRGCTEVGDASGAYRYKVNRGVEDLLGMARLTEYIDECIRPFVAPIDEEQVLSATIDEAIRKGVDVKKVLLASESRLVKTGIKEERERRVVRQDSFANFMERAAGNSVSAVAVDNAAKLKHRRTQTLA